VSFTHFLRGPPKQLQSFERRWEWRDLTCDKLTIGIGFHTRTLPAPPPLVSMYRFPTICSEAVCPHMAYQIVVGGQRGSACVVRFGSGRNKFVQLLIRSRNSSGRFVRSLETSLRVQICYNYYYITLQYYVRRCRLLLPIE